MAADPYSVCAHIRKPQPDMTINKEITDAIGNDFRVLPIFEKIVYEHNYKKYYSLKSNELLACRWREYVRQFESKVFAPFQFINIRDFHFYNGNIRLLPSASIYNKTDFRYKMKLGPGVDYRGEIPIPDEMIMKRGEHVDHRPEPLRKRKGKDAAIQVGLKNDISV